MLLFSLVSNFVFARVFIIKEYILPLGGEKIYGKQFLLNALCLCILSKEMKKKKICKLYELTRACDQ